MPPAASVARPLTSRLLSRLLAVMTVLLLATETASGAVAVTTQRYDNGRTGLNPLETVLTPDNLKSGGFGLRASAPVDGAVYAQPLLVPGLTINGQIHDVLFVATEHDTVYALDATSMTVLWNVSLLTPRYGAATPATTVSSSDVRCSDISPEYGITGTPVIDLDKGTLYVVSNSKEGHRGSIVYRLHALDILTGAPKIPSVAIQATVSGAGAASRRGVVTFDPTRHLQRAGLLLVKGTLAIAFSGHCDVDPYHGWIMTYDTSLKPLAAWTTAPNGTEAGVWMSGSGIVADANGDAYVSVGNGTFDGVTAFGNSVLHLDLAHLSGSTPVLDSFTPHDQAYLSNMDLDLGSGGVLLVPDLQANRNVLVVGGKTGTLYLLDRATLGGYDASANRNLQTLDRAAGGGVFSTPAYWNGTVYVQGKGDPLKAYSFDATGLLRPTPTSQSTNTSGFPGAQPVVSANGLLAGIAWTVQTDGYGSGAPAILHAYEAANLANEIYSSSQVAADQAGPAVKFVVPLVANGSVWVGANKVVTRYGFPPPSP